MPIEIFGMASGVLSLIGLLLYGRSVVWGETKPLKSTWFLWALNGFLLMSSYEASGADATVWLSLGYAVGCVCIFALTLKFGESGWQKIEIFCLIGAGIGAILWWLTGSPEIAFYSTLVIDMCGVVPTILHSKNKPSDESLLAWGVMFLGGVVSLFAIEEWLPLTLESVTIVAYPIQITLTAGLITWFLRKEPLK